MAVLPLLANPDSYRACEWDLGSDDEARAYWLTCFRKHLDTIERTLAGSATAEQLATLRDELHARLASIESAAGNPGRHVDILTLDAARTEALHAAGINDPFAAIKERENERSLAMLPSRLAQIDALSSEAERLDALVRGTFAGNIFDMGAGKLSERYLDDASLTFESALGMVKARPWLIDDLDHLKISGWRQAVILVDNAGSDLVLGVLPLARELLQLGTHVTLAANSGPALNDVTSVELDQILERAAVGDAFLGRALTNGLLAVVSTGTAAPLIDLMQISDELATVAADADLLILIGMGRALESNFSAVFTCCTWRLATIKDAFVAQRFGGELFDCVCRVSLPGG